MRKKEFETLMNRYTYSALGFTLLAVGAFIGAVTFAQNDIPKLAYFCFGCAKGAMIWSLILGGFTAVHAFNNK
ncbi:MAG: hypothetical protein AAB708_01885 [Patescibacteria group bacterium]